MTKLYMPWLLLLFAFACAVFYPHALLHSQEAAAYRIRDIIIEQNPVFSKEEEQELFVFPLFNALHATTKEYIVDDEILFSEGELVDEALLAETERNLMATGFFKKVAVSVDTVSDVDVDVYVVTWERWSTMPYLKLQTGGGAVSIGAGITDDNALGFGTKVTANAVKKTENDIGWEGDIALVQPRVFRSELTVAGLLRGNKVRTQQEVVVLKPFRTVETTDAWYAGASNAFGSDFFYAGDSVRLLPFHEQRAHLWYARAFPRKDRYFITASLQLQDVHRINPTVRQAMDNSGRFLVGFSSLAQQFRKEAFLNAFSAEDVAEGAWGTVVLGKVFAMQSGGEQLYYAGGQVEQSVFARNDLYLSGQVSAGSGFAGSEARYTYQEFLGRGFYRVSSRSLLAARIRQQTAWNWTAFRQLVLDNDAGLRGYGVNELTGDNRIVANVEYRVFPDVSLWGFQASALAFYDIGTVWQQSEKVQNARVYHSVGVGMRIHNEQMFGPHLLWRIDVPYNFKTQGVGQIVVAVQQLFSVFQPLQFRAPKIFGEEVDVQ